MLKDQGLKDVTQAIENIMTQFDHLRDKKSEDKQKQEKGRMLLVINFLSHHLCLEAKEGDKLRKQEDMQKKQQERFARKKQHAHKNNDLLKRLMNVSNLKTKRKDGKWRNKISLMDLYEKAKKFKQKSAKGKWQNLNLKLYTDKEKELNAEVRSMMRKLETLEDRNDILEEKHKRYEDLFADVTISILNYVTKVHNDIQEVSDDYKGIITFDDDEMLNKIKEKQEQREQGLKEETDKDVIKRLKKENMDLLRDLSRQKLMHQEIEVENHKFERKEKVLRDNINELKISFEEMQHRFEARIAEYKAQVHLKDERITQLNEQARFQRRMIAEQDQRLGLAENDEGT